MILSELKEYLQSNGQASLKDMAVRFDVSEEALAGMLDHFINKGSVKKLETTSCENVCGHKCSACPLQCSEIYVSLETPRTENK